MLSVFNNLFILLKFNSLESLLKNLFLKNVTFFQQKCRIVGNGVGKWEFSSTFTP